MKPCNKCNGNGTIEKDGKLYECTCSYIHRRAIEMPVYIRKAQVIKQHIQHQIINLSDKSLYIITSWNDIKAIIKVMMLKYSNKFIKITSDREIRDVYVGATSRAARGISSNDEDNMEIYNSLQDLMDLPDLMVVRLNEMHYKNKAAPGALEEAVSYRLDRDKPVWMVSNIDKPFVEGSHAWSVSVFELLNSAFEKMNIPRILPKVMINDGGFIPDMVVSPKFQEMIDRAGPLPSIMATTVMPVSAVSQPSNATPAPSRAPAPVIEVEPQEEAKKPQWKHGKKIKSVPDSDANPLAMYGSGITKSKKKYGN